MIRRLLDPLLALWRGRPQGDLAVGARGEQVALRHLQGLGWRLLARNLRLRGGEIDLLMDIPGQPWVVVVEVKTAAGSPGEAFRPERRVGARKRAKLLRLGRLARARHRELHGRPLRFDVVAVELHDGRKPPTVRHHADMFRG